MNAGEGLYNDSLDAQIKRCKGGVFTGRTLTIVDTADNDAFAQTLCTGGEILVTYGEAVFGNSGNIGTQRKNLCARRHDVVGSDVVPDLQA